MTIEQKVEAHNNTRNDVLRIVDLILGGYRYYNSVEFTEENRHDDKVTYVLTFEEIKDEEKRNENVV